MDNHVEVESPEKSADMNYSKVRIIYHNIIKGMNIIGSIWIFLTMLLIMYDVLMRGIFNKPFAGTAEIVRNTIVIILFLQIPYVLHKGRHIRSTIIVDKLPQKGKVVLTIVAGLLGAFLFSLVAYVSWDPFLTALITKQYEGEGALRVPTFPARLSIVIGSIFMVFQFLLMVHDAIRYGKIDIEELDE